MTTAAQLAKKIFDDVASVAIQNRDLKRKLRESRQVAQQGLAAASDGGVVVWRDALEKIIQITN